MYGVLWQSVDGFWCYVQDEQLDGAIPTQVNRHNHRPDQSNPVRNQHSFPASDPEPQPVSKSDTAPATSTQATADSASVETPAPTGAYTNWYGSSTPQVNEVCVPSTNNIASNTIETDRKIWRPSLQSEYIEPDPAPDILDGMEIIFKDFGKSLRKKPEKPPPRDDIIYFDEAKDAKELQTNLRWRDCPVEHQPAITNLIKQYWDVFAEEGLRRPILGFECRVDTGDVKPVCCKPPRYGPHEARVMEGLVAKLFDNDLIEEDDGPWGALIVLATKAQNTQQEPKWHEYEWRLCVSYRKLNQVTRPFTFPIPRCDDAVSDLPADAKFKILTDLMAGYWQVLLELASRGKLAFFTPTGKVRWKVMPMGFLNSHAIFVAMMTVIQKEWDEEAEKRGITRVGSKIIVDDILLWGFTIQLLLAYFEVVLITLKNRRATLKLKKTYLLPEKPDFVGVQVNADGNSPAESKYDAFNRIPPPETWSDLSMLIGMFGFYQMWIALYEVRIQPWRLLQTKRPKPGEVTSRGRSQRNEKLMDPTRRHSFSPNLRKTSSAVPCWLAPTPTASSR